MTPNKTKEVTREEVQDAAAEYFPYGNGRSPVNTDRDRKCFYIGANYIKENEQSQITALTKQRDDAIEVLRELVKISDDLYDDDDYNHDNHFAGRTPELASIIKRSKEIIK